MRRVRDLLRGPAIVCDGRATIREAAKLMTDAGRRAVVIPTETTGFGIFTEGDLRARVVVGGIDSNQPVSTVMTPSAVTVDPDRLGADAVTDMLEYGLRHLPVVTEAGALMGVLELSDLLTSATNQGFELRAALATAQDDAHLVETARAVPVLVTELVASRVSPLDIGATLAVLIDVTVRRAIELVVDGDERPDFAWLSLGSVARREALPLFGYRQCAGVGGGESHHEGADAAKTIHDILDLCGFPRDTKNAVATQARFARTLPQWRTALRKWVSNPYQTRPWSCCRCWRMPRRRGRSGVGSSPCGVGSTATAPGRHATAPSRSRRRQGKAPFVQGRDDASDRNRRPQSQRRPTDREHRSLGGGFPWAPHEFDTRTPQGCSGKRFPTRRRRPGTDRIFRGAAADSCPPPDRSVRGSRPPTDEVVISELTPLSRSLLSNAVREVAGVQRRLEYAASASALPDIDP